MTPPSYVVYLNFGVHQIQLTSSRPYTIDANILVASEAPASFGSFEGQLEIRYVVHDPDDRGRFSIRRYLLWLEVISGSFMGVQGIKGRVP